MRSGTQRGTTVHAEAGGHATDLRSGRRQRRRRAVFVGTLVLGAVAALLALTLVGTARDVQEDLLQGRSMMEQGRNE
ncbi:MAG: hypothetical protein ACXWXS_03460, partial [Actinomycetota bacterium]